MTDEAFPLLARIVARLNQEHVGRVLASSSPALSGFDPSSGLSFGSCVTKYKTTVIQELRDHTELLRKEVLHLVETTLLPLSSDSKAKIMDILTPALDADFYPKRLKIQIETMIRRGNDRGIPLDGMQRQIDMELATLNISTTNIIRMFLASISDDLEILVIKSKVLPATPTSDGESKLEGANDVIDLKPNFFGLGINFNALFRKIFKRKNGT